MNDLHTSVTMTIHHMAERALHHFQEESIEDAASIIGQWTTDSDESILTHHYLETTDSVKDIMLYVFEEDNSLGYGAFSFDPEAELPVDNN